MQQTVSIDHMVFQRGGHVQQHQQSQRKCRGLVRALQRLCQPRWTGAQSGDGRRRTAPPGSRPPSCNPGRPAARKEQPYIAQCTALRSAGCQAGMRREWGGGGWPKHARPAAAADSARMVMPAHLCQLNNLSRCGDSGSVHVQAERQVEDVERRQQPVRGDRHPVVALGLQRRGGGRARRHAASPRTVSALRLANRARLRHRADGRSAKSSVTSDASTVI